MIEQNHGTTTRQKEKKHNSKQKDTHKTEHIIQQKENKKHKET